MVRTILFAIMLCAATTGLAAAEVADSSASGFTVKIALSIQAAPNDVYRQLIHVGDWWNAEHTFSGDARNLSIEEKAGGCFCEKLPNGGGVRHLQVLFVAPGKTLRMGGGLGPLQGIAANGSMTIQLSPAGAGTKTRCDLRCCGLSSIGDEYSGGACGFSVNWPVRAPQELCRTRRSQPERSRETEVKAFMLHHETLGGPKTSFPAITVLQ